MFCSYNNGTKGCSDLVFQGCVDYKTVRIGRLQCPECFLKTLPFPYLQNIGGTICVHITIYLHLTDRSPIQTPTSTISVASALGREDY